MLPVVAKSRAASALLGLLWACTFSAIAAASDLPLPVSVTPSGIWDGIDGSWSSFNISVGTPRQHFRVFASWMAYQMWVVHPSGCIDGNTTCSQRRGGTFYKNESTTWDDKGLYTLAPETNLGLEGDGYFGFDGLALGGPGQELLALPNVTVVDFAVDDFYLGLLGINPKETNWTSFDDFSPSYMSQLKQANLIPSLSFGYSAGASYHSDNVFGTLTLGGYDQSRFEPNDIEFVFAGDNSRDVVVAIQSITATRGSSAIPASLLPNPVYALVDATVAEIWLPLEACHVFEQEFGLTYDNATDLYLVNASTHNSLLARNATVSFTIAQQPTKGPSTTINLPYAAFDLTAKSPYQQLAYDTRYFPLRRAANETQYTLGRTFMQEAYISVDYETARFNVSSAVWSQGAKAQLVTIPPAPAVSSTGAAQSSASGSSKGSALGIGAIAGIVCLSLLVVMALVAVYLIRYRKRGKTSKRSRHTPSRRGKSIGMSSWDETIASKAPSRVLTTNASELDTVSCTTTPTAMTPTSPNWPLSPLSPTMNGATWASEADGAPVHELPGSLPDINMADGRQITEKEMMQHRERLYNGYDAVEERRRSEREKSVHNKEPKRRKDVLLPGQVREATEEEGGNRRFSFVEGQDSIP